MEHIGKSLDAVLDSGELGDALAGYRAMSSWPAVVGDGIARQATATRFQDGYLVVEVSNSTWLQQLSFMRHKIIPKLNAAVGRNVVKSIKFVIAGGGPWSQKG